jgi:hypothetical protein
MRIKKFFYNLFTKVASVFKEDIQPPVVKLPKIKRSKTRYTVDNTVKKRNPSKKIVVSIAEKVLPTEEKIYNPKKETVKKKGRPKKNATVEI